jgi:hypothetical protein
MPKPKSKVATAKAVPKYDEWASKPCKEREGWGSTGKPGKPLGWSSLPKDVQADIEQALAAGANLSELSRKHGVSRDKVRTIRERMERASGRVH